VLRAHHLTSLSVPTVPCVPTKITPSFLATDDWERPARCVLHWSHRAWFAPPPPPPPPPPCPHRRDSLAKQRRAAPRRSMPCRAALRCCTHTGECADEGREGGFCVAAGNKDRMTTMRPALLRQRPGAN